MLTRKIDLLGRFVITKIIRTNFNIIDKEMPLEIYTKDNEIIIRQAIETCYICNQGDDLKIFKGENICEICIECDRQEMR